MKVKLHIPTETFGYIETEVEVETIGEALHLYDASVKLKIAPTEGLTDKEFNRVVDEYLSTGSVKDGTNLWEQMSLPQREWFQTTKRAFARISPEKSPRVRLELK